MQIIDKIIPLLKNSEYTRRITIPKEILKAFGYPKELYLTYKDDEIILKAVKED